MSLTLNVSHTIFWVTIADFKQENVYLDSFFWVWNYIHIQRCCQVHVQAQSVVAKCTYKLRETGGQPAPFPGAKFFSHVKSEHIKFLHVKNIWDLSLFIEQDISDKK